MNGNRDIPAGRTGVPSPGILRRLARSGWFRVNGVTFPSEYDHRHVCAVHGLNPNPVVVGRAVQISLPGMEAL